MNPPATCNGPPFPEDCRHHATNRGTRAAERDSMKQVRLAIQDTRGLTATLVGRLRPRALDAPTKTLLVVRLGLSPLLCGEGVKILRVSLAIECLLILEGVEHVSSQDRPKRMDGIVSIQPFRHHALQRAPGWHVPLSQLSLDREVDDRVHAASRERNTGSLVIALDREQLLALVERQPLGRFSWTVWIVTHGR